VECYGRGWLDVGIHLAKFDLLLPSGKLRPTSIAATLNMLCPRLIFEMLDEFSGEYMIGDTIFSWDVYERGYRIIFAPDAVVVHRHTSSWPGMLEERYVRGREFGQVRAHRFKWSHRRILLQILLTLLPIRWLNLMRRTLTSCYRAGMLGEFIATLPIIMSGHTAWLLGEAHSLFAAL